MPVCARDVGTYVGFMAVLIAFVVLARYQNGKLPDKVIITVAAVGLAFYAFDAFSSYLGFRSTTNDIRLISGLAFGSGISMLLFSAVSNLLYGKRTDHSQDRTKERVAGAVQLAKPIPGSGGHPAVTGWGSSF